MTQMDDKAAAAEIVPLIDVASVNVVLEGTGSGVVASDAVSLGGT